MARGSLSRRAMAAWAVVVFLLIGIVLLVVGTLAGGDVDRDSAPCLVATCDRPSG